MDNKIENLGESIVGKGELRYKETGRLLFFGIPWPLTKYELYDNDFVIINGLFSIKENDCYMYKIVDVKLTQSFMERLCGLGTITCYTGDTTDKELVLKHIKNSEEIKTYLLKTSEEARIKRRTVNMLDIGSGDVGDVNDIDLQ